jgi:hypothetical protein
MLVQLVLDLLDLVALPAQDLQNELERMFDALQPLPDLMVMHRVTPG